ncbi:MAG: gliding motility-associated-like protein [Saprospiraceae bacterium]|jgi:gliding motility-associated-like protein
MGRIILTLCICIFISFYGKSQCPDLPNNVQVNNTNDADFPLCGAQSVSFTVNDINLPTGTIDWYSSSSSGFDPLTGGTLLGSSTSASTISECSTCPEIEALFIDVCNDLADSEDDNEFMVVSSGSGFNVDNFSLTFPNPAFASPDAGINTGDMCNWTDGDLSLISGCGSEIIAAGPGDFIPANSIVIIQTSTTGTITYDVSPLCGLGDCIYVLQNSCDRISAGFKNCDASGGTRTVTINLSCGCSNVLTYDISNICSGGGGGTYYTKGGVVGNDGCTTAPTIPAPPIVNHNTSTTQFNYLFMDADCNTTQYIVGVYNSTEYNNECCGEDAGETNEYSFSISCPEAQLSGGGSLCPGDCVEIDVLFTGGDAPYELNMQLTGLPFPIPLPPLPGFAVDDKITICYDTGGPIFDQATNTVNVPSTFGGLSGGLELLSFTDSEGCAGTVTGGSVSIEFNDAPNIVTPPPFTACDMGDGTAFFILSDFDNIINGGSGLTVNYFSDAMGAIPISNPYQSGSTTIYAQVIDIPCNSEIVPVTLEVISNGDAGIVNMFCNTGGGNSTECTICDDDNIPGEEVTITIAFQDGSVVYDFEVTVTPNGGSSYTITGTSTGASGTIIEDIFQTTTFQVTLVDPDNDCADMTNLGDPVTIFYGLLPDMDNPGNLSNCGDIILPVITGNEIPPNAGYYTMPGGMGTLFMAGDVISTSTTLYLYGGFEDCEQEFDIDLTIESAGTIDDPGTINTCGSYILPAISGTNVNNANYYTETNGDGLILPVGQNITASTTIYIFDPICMGTEVSFMVNITPGSVITTGPDTIVCDTFFIGTIEGFDLTGNETYFELIGGSGQELSIGDTITQDSTIYIYDNTPGCIIEIPFAITVSKPQFPGIDSSVTICEGDPTLYNINELLAGNAPDTTGVWIENGTSIISESTMVDFSTLLAGSYTFDYMISDTICTDTSATLIVNIIGIVNAGLDTLLAVCENISGVNVYELLGNPDQGGIFVDNTGTPGAFDPANATFTTDVPGLIVYNYIVGDPASSCGADTSIFSVITGTEIQAGDDYSETLCAGNQISLSSPLTNNSTIGIFSETTPSGGIVNTSDFNSAFVSDGDYIIYHILAGSGQCPDDTAVITITVVDGPSAGDEQSLEVCGNNQIVNLEELKDSAADPNGSFYLNGVEITNTSIDLTGVTENQDYLYIVGNGIGCPFDTAELTIIIPIQPDSGIELIGSPTCTGDCSTVNISADAIGTQEITAFFSISDNNGTIDNRSTTFFESSTPLSLELCEGNGLLTDNILMAGNTYTISFDSFYLDSPDCIFYPANLIINLDVLSDSDSLLQGTYCFGEEITVGPDTYNQDNQNGETIIPAANGCDSTITIDFTFLDVITGVYEESRCLGESIEVLGITYTTNYMDDTLLVGASVGGCDSLITIDLTFLSSVEGTPYTETACEGDSIEVLGVTYTSSYFGDITLVGASAGGCDSIVTLDITILQNEKVPYLKNKCEGDTEEVGGITFTQTMNSGVATIPGGASNGCDLILDVFFIYIETVEIVLDTAVCDNFSIDIGGETYDISNPVDMVILPSNNIDECDTLVMIDLDFSLAAIDSSIIFSTCDYDVSFVIGGQTFNSTNPMGDATETGINGDCDTTFTIDITYGEMGVDLIEIDAGCEVIDSGSVIINNINGVSPYNIVYNGNVNLVFDLPIDIPLPIGMSELLITDAGGCQTTISYEVLEGEEEGNFSIVANGNQLTITGGVVDSVSWSPTDLISCIDCIDPIVNPSVTTTYIATIYFGGDCMIALEYVFEIEDNVDDYIVPSGFSPNGDGANDNFFLTITDAAIGTPQSMEIYDRWGNNVHTTIGDQVVLSGWDGTRAGTPVTSGVYVYRILVLEGDRVITIYGDVTVVR